MSRHLRVLFLSWRDQHHPEAGGAEKYLVEVAEGLARRGHQVTVRTAAYPGAIRDEVVHGVAYSRRGGRFGVFPRALASRLAGRLRADVVVDIQNGVPFLSPLAGGRVINLVHHVHREQWPVVVGKKAAGIGWWLESEVAPRVYRKVPYVVVSPSTGRELTGLGTADDRADWHLPGATPLETVPVARVNTFAVDPLVPGTLYAGVEIGGVWHSDDAGDTWTLRSEGLPSLGIHALAPHPLEPETLFAATETGIYRTVDGGLSWAWRPFDAGAGYTRALLVLPPAGPDAHPTLFAGPAEVDIWGWTEERDGARSSLYRSVDDGSGQWEQLGSKHGLPDSFEGLISVLAADPADPYAIWLGTWDGRVYLSRDRGDSWTQTAEDLSDIWCLCPLSE